MVYMFISPMVNLGIPWIPTAGSSPGKSKVSIFGDTILVGADRDSLNGKKVRFLKHLRKGEKNPSHILISKTS